MATYEGKWRCPACREVNLGRHLHCQSCGFKADESVEYFLDENPSEVSGAELLSVAHEAENWICSHCQGHNRANFTVCSGCGNARDFGDTNLISEVRDDFTNWSERKPPNAATQFPIWQKSQASTSTIISSWLKKPFVFIPIFAILFSCGICSFISSLPKSSSQNPTIAQFKSETPPRTAEVEVVDLEWKTAIAIEEFKTLTEKGWKNEIPSDAKILSSERAVRDYEKVQVGTKTIYENYTERERDGEETYTETVSDGTEQYKCGVINKKNGFFEDKYCTRTKYKTVTRTRPRYRNVTKTSSKQEPVYERRPIYDTEITYQVERWVVIDSAEKTGRGFQPLWEQVVITKGKRAGEKTEQFKILLRETGEPQNTFWKEIAPSELKNFPQGKRFSAKINDKGELLSFENPTN
jgi:hypothetical protein